MCCKCEIWLCLLEVVFKLMVEKGMEGVVINEIIEVVDVGFGLFYNYFELKEVIYLVLMDWVFEEFVDMLDWIVDGFVDFVEVIVVFVWYMLLCV